MCSSFDFGKSAYWRFAILPADKAMVRQLAAAARVEGMLGEQHGARTGVENLGFELQRVGIVVTKQQCHRLPLMVGTTLANSGAGLLAGISA